MNKDFKAGFVKTAFFGNLLNSMFVGMEASDIMKKVKQFGNRHVNSMKAPSFYSYRKLPKIPMYRG